MTQNYYQRLGLPQDASEERIKTATLERVNLIKQAYSVLANPAQRDAYDLDLDQGRTQSDYYSVLGLERGASGDAVKQAAETQMTEVKALYQVLKDPQQRATYDASLNPSAAPTGLGELRAKSAPLKPKPAPEAEPAGREAYDPYAAPGSELRDDDEYGEFKLFSFNGRVGRIRYIAYSLGVTILGQLIIGALAAAAPSLALPLLVLLGGGVLLISLMLGVQRLHDFNASAWLVLLLLIPPLNFFMVLALWFVPGSDGRNRYGLPGPPNRAWEGVVAMLLPVIFIVGIIAAVSIPSYLDYRQRAEAVAPVLTLLSLKTPAHEYISQYNEFPSAGQLGVSVEAPHLTRIETNVEEWYYQAVLENGQTVRLRYDREQGVWWCGSGEPNGAPLRNLPPTCRDQE